MLKKIIRVLELKMKIIWPQMFIGIFLIMTIGWLGRRCDLYFVLFLSNKFFFSMTSKIYSFDTCTIWKGNSSIWSTQYWRVITNDVSFGTSICTRFQIVCYGVSCCTADRGIVELVWERILNCTSDSYEMWEKNSFFTYLVLIID